MIGIYLENLKSILKVSKFTCVQCDLPAFFVFVLYILSWWIFYRTRFSFRDNLKHIFVQSIKQRSKKEIKLKKYKRRVYWESPFKIELVWVLDSYLEASMPRFYVTFKFLLLHSGLSWNRKRKMRYVCLRFFFRGKIFLIKLSRMLSRMLKTLEWEWTSTKSNWILL